MSASPPLFVELCAGTAALSLRLQARHARPPVSRMGAKTGYADAILAVMGLRPGQRAGHYLWCEPDPGCRLLLEAYRDRELAQAAADIIRGWKDEEPRALWDRLRAEGPVKEDGGAREVGRWAYTWATSIRNRGPDAGCDVQKLIGSPCTETFGAIIPLPDVLPDRFDALPPLPATIAPDARAVDPREVARWLVGEAWTNSGRYMGPDRPSACHPPGWVASITLDGVAGRVGALPVVPADITSDARTVEPVPPLPPGTIAYMDPPYVGTTGYASDLPRSEVVRLARLWHEAGAQVYISEAEPLAELDGWHRVEITATRRGQKRTFSAQQAEWLTCSHRPAWTPAVQSGLFGGGS